MSANVWAGGTTLPLTSWRDGEHIYVSATPLPMTATQAREAALRLIEHADAVEQGDSHAGALERLDAWKTRQRGRECVDCDGGPQPCVCETALGRYPMSDAEQLAAALDGR